VLLPQTLEPLPLLVAREPCLRHLGEIAVVRGVGGPDGLGLPGRAQTVERVLADGGEHLESAAGAPAFRSPEQVLVEQAHQPAQHRGGFAAGGTQDGLRRLDLPAPGEDRQTPEELLLVGIEEVVTQVDGRPQRPMARRRVAAAAREELERVLEPAQHLVPLEQLHAGGGQLDGERQAVEARGDRRDRGGVRVGELEVRPHRGRALDEQLDRRGLQDPIRPAGRVQVREGQCRHRELVLTGEAKARPARRQHLEAGTVPQKLGHERRSRRKVLEVVEHEEQPPTPQEVLELVDQRAPALFAQAQGLRDRAGDRSGTGDRGERNEADGVGVVPHELGSDLQGEPGLAHPAGAREREEADLIALQQAARGVELARDRSAASFAPGATLRLAAPCLLPACNPLGLRTRLSDRYCTV
jgi:hypothetical protein